MQYHFAGTHQESLASGRPIFPGDVVDEKDVTEVDKARLALVENPDATPAPAPAAAPPAPTTPEAT